MLRRSLAAALVLFAVGGILLAETYQGVITSMTKDEIKISVRKKGEKEGEAKTFKVSKDVKIQKSQGKDKEATDAKMEDITKAIDAAKEAKKGPKGVFAKIETEGSGENETVTKVTFGGGGKGKGKREDK